MKYAAGKAASVDMMVDVRSIPPEGEALRGRGIHDTLGEM